MTRLSFLAAFALLGLAAPVVPLAASAAAATSAASRDANRDRLGELLATVGKRSDVNIDFHRVEKNPYNFAGVLRTGLRNSDVLEVVFSVTDSDTISMRVYPHYKGAYINLDKARDPAGLMRSLLKMNATNFLFWGADDTSDVFAGFSFTLESGFPSEALVVVVRSIPNQDNFVGALRPYVDGTSAAK